MPNDNGYLTKEKLSNATRELEVSIPEIGGKIKIRGLTLFQRNKCREMSLRDPISGDMDIQRFQAFMIIEAMVNPKLDIGDIDFVGNLPCGVGDKILTEIYKASGMDVVSIESKKNG